MCFTFVFLNVWEILFWWWKTVSERKVFSFWEEFKKCLNVVVNKKRMDKYELLEEMEERRIKKYVAYLI